MMKLALPILLSSIVMIAGIFAFMPVYEASTVHTTLAGSGDVTTVQNSQFNNVNSTVQTNLANNATATCSAGSFLVYYTFTNGSAANTGLANATLGIDYRQVPSGVDHLVRLSGGNSTISGIIAGAADVSFNFTGMHSDTVGGVDSGELSITVQCQSTATRSLTP